MVNNKLDMTLTRYAQEYANDPEFIAEGLSMKVIEEMLKYLEQKGLNQSWLAEKMGVSRAHISRILNAPSNMTLLTIAKIAVALGVTPDVSLCAAARQPIPAKQETSAEIQNFSGHHSRSRRDNPIKGESVSVCESPSNEYKGCGSSRGRK